MPIPTAVAEIAGVESMATTCSSLESTFQKSDSNCSLNLNVGSLEEEDEMTNKNPIEFGPESLRIISIDEVGDHYTSDDAWMVIYDKVYDFTHFLQMVSTFTSCYCCEQSLLCPFTSCYCCEQPLLCPFTSCYCCKQSLLCLWHLPTPFPKFPIFFQ